MRLIGLILLASLAACSGKGAGDNAAANAVATAGNAQGGTASASNRGLRDQLVAQCVAQAQASTPLKVDFTPICGCSTDKLLASKSPAELAKGVTPAEAKAVAGACAKEHPITAPAKS